MKLSVLLAVVFFCFSAFCAGEQDSLRQKVYRQNCEHRYGHSPFSNLTFIYEDLGKFKSGNDSQFESYFNVKADFELTGKYSSYGKWLFALQKNRIKSIDIVNLDLKLYSDTLNEEGEDADWGGVKLAFKYDSAEKGPLLIVDFSSDGDSGFASFRCEPFPF